MTLFGVEGFWVVRSIAKQQINQNAKGEIMDGR
jgi:hypothetical protein